MAHAKYLSAVGTASVGGAGSSVRVHGILVGTGAASAVVKLFNGDAATDPQVCEINAAAAGYWPLHRVDLSDGMFVDLSGGNAKVTVLYD